MSILVILLRRNEVEEKSMDKNANDIIRAWKGERNLPARKIEVGRVLKGMNPN